MTRRRRGWDRLALAPRILLPAYPPMTLFYWWMTGSLAAGFILAGVFIGSLFFVQCVFAVIEMRTAR